MAAKSVPPSLTLNSFSCPHCGAHAQQLWWNVYGEWITGLPPRAANATAANLLKVLQAHSEKNGIPAATDPPPLWGVAMSPGSVSPNKDRSRLLGNVMASSCHPCKKIAIWVGDQVVYPPAKLGEEPNPDLPPDILRDYQEAQTILALSPRGAAALLRLAIQKLCILLGGKGKNIDADIAALVKKGLSIRVQQALDIVRVVGNEAVHPGELDLRDDHDTAVKLLGLVNLIAEKMISEPKHVEDWFGSLPEGKREAISRRDKLPE